MNKIRLEIIGLTSGQTQGSYTLILGEEVGDRKLPIVIGGFEAQAIAIEIEKIIPFRPMTHDLFVSFCKTFQVEVEEVIIHALTEGVFYSKLRCQQAGRSYEIDARTSDAIALSVRFKCPVYTTPEVLEIAGVTLEDEVNAHEHPGRPEVDQDHHEPGKPKEEDLSALNEAELQIMLDKALMIEDYAKAASIRDEIKRRK